MKWFQENILIPQFRSRELKPVRLKHLRKESQDDQVSRNKPTELDLRVLSVSKQRKQLWYATVKKREQLQRQSIKERLLRMNRSIFLNGTFRHEKQMLKSKNNSSDIIYAGFDFISFYLEFYKSIIICGRALKNWSKEQKTRNDFYFQLGVNERKMGCYTAIKSKTDLYFKTM